MLIRFFATFLAVAAATFVVPGIKLESRVATNEILTLIGVAAIFGVVNSLVKPLFRMAATPVALVILAGALWVVNALLLTLTSWFCSLLHLGWTVTDPLSAMLGALLVSVVSFLVNALFGRRGVDHR